MGKYRKCTAISKVLVIALTLCSCVSLKEMKGEAFAIAFAAKEKIESLPESQSTFESIEFKPVSNRRITAELFPGLSPIFSFSTGNSYIAPVILPETSWSKTLMIRSEMINAGRNKIPTVFVPNVLFLNNDKSPVKEPIEVTLCFYRGWTEENVGYFGKLDNIPEGSVYAIFFTDLRKIGETIPYRSSGTFAGGGLITNMNFAYDFPRSPEGRLDIWVANHDNTNDSLSRRCW